MKLKHRVFSPRTTGKTLESAPVDQVRAECKLKRPCNSRPCAHYRLEREVMALTMGIVQLRLGGTKGGQARLRNMLRLSTKKRPRVFSTGPILSLAARIGSIPNSSLRRSSWFRCCRCCFPMRQQQHKVVVSDSIPQAQDLRLVKTPFCSQLTTLIAAHSCFQRGATEGCPAL